MPLTQAYFDFFKSLANNNNSEWFHANKKSYEADAKLPFIALLKDICAALADSEPFLMDVDPKKMLFRINRDIRFSKDKRPYKEHISAVLSRAGTKDKELPGHYFHIEYGSVSIGGGAYFLEKEKLYRVRQYIEMNPERFEALINAPDFIACFENIKGDKNKIIPKDFKAAHSQQPLIANTQFYWWVELDPKLALRDDFVELVAKYFRAAKPLNDFLTEAMYREV